MATENKPPLLRKECDLLSWAKQMLKWTTDELDYVATGSTDARFWGIVTDCDYDSGFALVKRAAGTIGALAAATTTKTPVFIGIESHIRVNDEVLCLHNGDGILPYYTAFRPIRGIHYVIPTAPELAATQDTGAVICTTCCDETVTALG